MIGKQGLNKLRMAETDVTCSDLGDAFPSVEDFNAALGGGAIALYVVCAIVIIILSVQFGYLSRHFLRHVPDSRKVTGFNPDRISCFSGLNAFEPGGAY